MVEKRIKIKISKNFFLALILIFVFVAIVIYYKISEYQPLTSISYDNVVLQFRADLREANKLQADEEAIRSILWDRNIENITIVFTSSSDLELVNVEAFEITYKLKLAYLIKGYKVDIKGKEVENLTSDFPSPSIVLIPPSLSNKTGIEVKNKTIIISGKDKQGFDLAVVKFLIVALGIKIS